MLIISIIAIFTLLLVIFHRVCDIRYYVLAAEKITSKQISDLNERISNLHDHVRSTEKALFRLMDDFSKHGYSKVTLEPLSLKLEALQKEIANLHNIKKKATKPCPKKQKTTSTKPVF